MKKKFVLRLDEDVYNALEKWAADEFRSANGQIEWLLAHQLKLNGRYKAIHHAGLRQPPQSSGEEDAEIK